MKRFFAAGLVLLATTFTAQAHADDFAFNALLAILGTAAVVSILDQPHHQHRRDYYDYNDGYRYGYPQQRGYYDNDRYRDDYRRHEGREHRGWRHRSYDY